MRPTLAALALLTACHGGPGPDDPIVILISVDTLRADHVGLLGAERSTTPNLDAFFEPGTVFTSTWSGAPCTIPSVRQTLSGGFDLGEGRPRLPEILQSAGYRTLASTSQHFFDDEQGDYGRGFDVFEMQSKSEEDPVYGMTTRMADKVVDRGIALLDGWPWQTGPTFLWMHLFDPHDPYMPPPTYRGWAAETGSDKTDGDRRKLLMDARPGETWSWMTAGEIFDADDVAYYKAMYDGEIAYADAALGRFFHHLETRGWADRAVVVFWSDHGEELGEHDGWDHCRTLDEWEIHVPLMVRDAGGRLGDLERVTSPTSTLDILPTLVARLGLELPAAEYHGTDLMKLPEDRKTISMWRTRRAVRDERWKLKTKGGEALCLYDIATDPGQTRNLIDVHPEEASRLKQALDGIPDLEARVADEIESDMRTLEIIGYIGDGEKVAQDDDSFCVAERVSPDPPSEDSP